MNPSPPPARIAVFQDKEIRKTLHDEWWFGVEGAKNKDEKISAII